MTRRGCRRQNCGLKNRRRPPRYRSSKEKGTPRLEPESALRIRNSLFLVNGEAAVAEGTAGCVNLAADRVQSVGCRRYSGTEGKVGREMHFGSASRRNKHVVMLRRDVHGEAEVE